MAQVTLGNFFNSGGKTVVGGSGGSGIDTEAMVKALTDAKAIPATQKQDKIKINESKTAALNEFKTLVGKLRDAASALRNPPGVGNAADNAFRYTTASLTSNTAAIASDYVGVTASPGAPLQSFVISDITSTAQAKRQASSTFSIATADAAAVTATDTPGMLKAGTFSVKAKNGESRSITLSVGESLSSVAAKFNAVSNKTGISASVIKLADGQFQLSFSATKTGLDSDFDLNNLEVGLTSTLTDAGGVFDNITLSNKQDAANAVFKFNGADITRQTNAVADLVGGLTFTIKQVTTAAPVDTDLTIAIKPDEAIVKSNVIKFVDAYNALKIFAAKQSESNDDGTLKSTSLLNDNSTFRGGMNNINSYLAGAVVGLESSVPRALSDLGITFYDQEATDETPQVRNLLTVDDQRLANEISSNPDNVRRVFEFDYTTDNTAFRVFSRTNAMAVNEFKFMINPYATQTTRDILVADADTVVASATPGAEQLKTGTITINGQGITIEDTDTLNTIASKFNAVQGSTGVSATVSQVSAGQYKLVFTSTLTGSNENFDLKSADVDPTGVFDNINITSVGSYKATYGSPTQTIDVDVEPLKTDLTPDNPDDDTYIITGYTIKGKAGTVLDGVVFVYAGTNAGSANISATQGLADKIYNIADPLLKRDTGGIAVELDAVKTATTRLNDDIKKINDQVEQFRLQLLEKFSRMEQAVAQVNRLLSSLDANDQARNNS
jgi:flagellar hook-associated protein 2